MRTTLQRIAMAGAMASGLSLVACGGASDLPSADMSTATAVPGSAATTMAAPASYGLPSSPSGRGEPVSVGTLQLSKDDRAEPSPIL